MCHNLTPRTGCLTSGADSLPFKENAHKPPEADSLNPCAFLGKLPFQTDERHIITADPYSNLQWDSGVRFKPLTTFGSLKRMNNETNSGVTESDLIKWQKVNYSIPSKANKPKY